MRSGYKTLTPIQIANVLAALDDGRIGLRELRVYFACFALVAVREAAGRYRRRRRQAPRPLTRYRLKEFQRLTAPSTGLRAGPSVKLRASLPTVRPALRRLQRAGLVNYSEGDILITTDPLPGSATLLDALRCGRSPRRPIPVPRSVLRFLARTRKAALIKTMLAYVVRGLSLARTHGTVTGKGTVKISWIAETLGLSERAARYARLELIRLGWFAKDTGSRQLKLNRDGAYFVLNLDWSPAAKSQEPTSQNVAIFAPPPPKNGPIFAPPYKDKKTSYEGKHQQTRAAEPAGVCNGGKEKPPTLRQVIPADLWSFGRLEAIYGQAVAAGWIRPSEAQALDFIAAAVRARQVANGDPVRIFVATVRQRLWHHITLDQEDHARRALNRFRDQNPDRFRILSTRPNGPPVKLVSAMGHQPLSRPPGGIDRQTPAVGSPVPGSWQITPFEGNKNAVTTGTSLPATTGGSFHG